MLKRIQKSIVFRIGILMVALVTVAIGAMLSSYLLVDNADRDAESVNLSGSLRMQSYRVLSVLLEQQNRAGAIGEEEHQQVTSMLDTLEDRLQHALLITEAEERSDSDLFQRYQAALQSWQGTVRPRLESHINGTLPMSGAALQELIAGFVNELEQLVQSFQVHAEDRIENLRIVQLVALFVTLALVAISLTILHRQVEVPLRVLTQRAERIGQGDFSARVELDNEDELGLLASTINRMSGQLEHMYETLESQVQDKTKELEQTARSLDFLYRMAREVSENARDLNFQTWLEQFSRITDIDAVELCLTNPEAVFPYEHLRSDYLQNLPKPCLTSDCETCLATCSREDSVPTSSQVKVPLLKEGVRYGVIVCSVTEQQPLLGWQQQLLQSFADQVTVALNLKNQGDQERREALMNERNVIARELHDSLAQSLSYLKIQVARLTHVLSREELSPQALSEIADELKEGITSAYRQLRELLTTFRLTISEKGLQAAVEHTVQQMQEQNHSAVISLDYRVSTIPFTPNEEIHLLQLVREALQNASRHSRGSEIRISLTAGADNLVRVMIEDNGIGIPDDPDKLNHYGLAIMRERCRNLQGSLRVERRPAGGTAVVFEFEPDYWHNREVFSLS